MEVDQVGCIIQVIGTIGFIYGIGCENLVIAALGVAVILIGHRQRNFGGGS